MMRLGAAGGADWSAVLLEAAAYVTGATVTLAAVVVGARVYREGLKDRPVEPAEAGADEADPEA